MQISIYNKDVINTTNLRPLDEQIDGWSCALLLSVTTKKCAIGDFITHNGNPRRLLFEVYILQRRK